MAAGGGAAAAERADAELRVATLAGENTALRAQLEAERQRAMELEAYTQRARGPGVASPLPGGSKKHEDGSLDLEAAALEGECAREWVLGGGQAGVGGWTRGQAGGGGRRGHARAPARAPTAGA